MAGFDNDVLYADNVDFTGSFPVSGQINQDGELLVGSTVAPFIRAYVPTGSNNVNITTGAGTLDFSLSGPPSATSLTNHGIVIGQGTSAVTTTTAGSSGQVLMSSGGSANPNWSTATFPISVGNVGTILRSDGTNWVATTATYPDTTTISQILYSSSANVISGLSTANNSILVTSATGVPSLGTSLLNDFTFTSATAGATRTLTISNTDNTNAASTALLQVTTGGASAGDPFHTFTVTGATSWSQGIDNSVSDNFVLAASTALGTTNVMSATTGGAVSFVLGNVDITKSSSGATVSTTVSNTSNTASSNALQQVTVAGTSAGDAFTTYTVSGTTNWSIGVDNSATTPSADPFVIAASTSLGTTNIMAAATTGEINYPLQPAFLAYLANQAANKTGAGTTYTLGTDALTELYDQNSDFNTNGTFTAPVTGKYFLQCKMRVGGITAAMTLGLLVLVTTARSYQFEGGGPGATKNGSNTLDFMINQLADMTAGDTATITIKLSNGAGDVADIDGNVSPEVTWYSGYLVC